MVEALEKCKICCKRQHPLKITTTGRGSAGTYKCIDSYAVGIRPEPNEDVHRTGGQAAHNALPSFKRGEIREASAIVVGEDEIKYLKLKDGGGFCPFLAPRDNRRPLFEVVQSSQLERICSSGLASCEFKDINSPQMLSCVDCDYDICAACAPVLEQARIDAEKAAAEKAAAEKAAAEARRKAAAEKAAQKREDDRLLAHKLKCASGHLMVVCRDTKQRKCSGGYNCDLTAKGAPPGNPMLSCQRTGCGVYVCGECAPRQAATIAEHALLERLKLHCKHQHKLIVTADPGGRAARKCCAGLSCKFKDTAEELEPTDAMDLKVGQGVNLGSNVTSVQVTSLWKGRVDLDAGMMLYEAKSHWNNCYCGTKNVASGTVTLDKDMTGGDGQQREVLTCKLNKLPTSVTTVVCYICVYNSSKTFSDARDVSIEIKNSQSGKRLAAASSSSVAGMNSRKALLLGSFNRLEDNSWVFVSLMRLTDGRGPGSDPLKSKAREYAVEVEDEKIERQKANAGLIARRKGATKTLYLPLLLVQPDLGQRAVQEQIRGDFPARLDRTELWRLGRGGWCGGYGLKHRVLQRGV